MKYSDLIKVNENFQYSVNLQFDLNNISKINDYIPTKDGCEILKFYINSILNGKNRSTTLIGPYGKGKSHLLLVLITVINDYEKDDEQYINSFLEKVNKVDPELYNMLRQLRSNKIKFMPIIINSNYNDLNQAFLLGISEALEREKVNNVIINTYFDIALNVLEDWETNYKDVLFDIQKCLKEYDCSLFELKKQLKKYSDVYYEIFKKIYKCVSRGQEFSPLVNGDIIKIYKDINHELEKKGYTGMFIAFDEFSKFLESSNENLMKDLKIIQDFAELSSRTGKTQQVHLSCITHKSINEYFKDFDESKSDAFKTIEGRFKTVYFNRSLEQNYEIVSYAIEKDKRLKNVFINEFKAHEQFYNDISNMHIFKNTNNINQILFEGCFPLNPITVYSLIELSEKVAQNERTLFTFITDDDQNSLKSFIVNNGSGLFNVDKIYDYFKSILKKEDDSYIKSIWIKSQNSLKKNLSDNAQRIIKSLSIIYMIKNLDQLFPDDDTLKLSCDLSDIEYAVAINELLDKSILRKRKITGELDFATMYSKEITNEIKTLVDSKFSDITEKDTINKIVDKWYSLPRRYNEKYKMTRFFINLFMTENEIMSISNFDLLFEQNYCDGIVINLLKYSKNVTDVINKFQTLNDDRVVLKISKSTFTKSFSNLLKEYEAINFIKEHEIISDGVIDELDDISNEIESAISEAIKEFFSEDNVYEYVYMSNRYKRINYISPLLSDICEEIYKKTPVINNEMINKLELSAPIKKARNIVIDCVLQNNITLIKSPTSAEATIYKAIVDKKNEDSVNNVLNIIRDFIKSNNSEKKSFDVLYNILMNKPYSIRKGIIPVLLSIVLYDYSNNIILYYMNREIDLNSENLVKLNDNPEKYYLQVEKGTTEKIDYLTYLMSLYEVPKTSDVLVTNVKKTLEAMKKWILSMPRIIRECSGDSNTLGIDKRYVDIKSELLRPDLNANGFLFTELLNIFDTEDYNLVIVEINNMKNIFDSMMRNYLLELVDETKKIFNNNFKGGLTSLLKEWYKDLNTNKKNKIHDLTTKNLLNYISTLNTHDENDVIENLSKIITGFYVEDWQPFEKDNYIKNLENIILKINTSKENCTSEQKILLVNGNEIIEKTISSFDGLSALGKTMRNNIEEVISEYGESLSEQEKVNVLLTIMKKYM